MAGAANKTQATAEPVQAFLAGVAPEERRADATALCEMMSRLSGEPPRMWGPSIVGFGERHYRYDSGREGDICKVGFSPRKANLALYGFGPAEANPDLAKLGKVTTAKACIYIKQLADVNAPVLEAMIVRALAR